MMDLKNKRCGECGRKSYVKKNISGHWKKSWKDFPSVFLRSPIELWLCSGCGEYAMTPGDAERIDSIVDDSVREQVSQFLTIISSKSGLNYSEIALRLGYSSSYIASLRSKSKTPSFKIWNQLKVILLSPIEEMEKLDPGYVFEDALLRA